MQGQNAANQIFEVWNSGGGTLSFTNSYDADWVTVTSTNGSSTGEYVTNVVSYSTASLPAGTYIATNTISGNATNSPHFIVITLNVLPTCQPHPADTNSDFEISVAEVTRYVMYWR